MTPISFSTSRRSFPIWIVALLPVWSSRMPRRLICMVLNPTMAMATSRMSRPMTFARLPTALTATSVLSTAAAFRRTKDSTASSVFTGLNAAQSLILANVSSASFWLSMTALSLIRYCSMVEDVWTRYMAPRRTASKLKAAMASPLMEPRTPARAVVSFCASPAAFPVSCIPRFAADIPLMYCDESSFSDAYSCATSILDHIPPNIRRRSSGES